MASIYIKLSINPNMKKKDYIKANRKGSRDAELENSTGWVAKTKIHKCSKDAYNRKKFKKNFYVNDED